MADPLLSIEVNLAGAGPSRKEFEIGVVNGMEGISIPYSYDVILFRDKTKPDILPEKIINTVARIGINKGQGNKPEEFFRTGVFEHFEKAGTGTKNDTFRMYRGRIVPAFKLLDREVRFRVFENRDVVEILETILRGVSNLEINTSLLRRANAAFPKMEYCVQFGESTLAFLLRLMERFGIHYIFDHRGSPDAPQNDTMIFGQALEFMQQCQQDEVDIVADDDHTDKPHEISGFVQRFEPVARSVRAGNFNPLAPTKPFTSTRFIDPDFDLANLTPGPVHDFRREEFPVSFDSAEDAKAYAESAQHQEESRVRTFVGRGTNRTFIPGRTIFIRKDAIHLGTGDTSLKDKTLLLTWVCFAAIEPAAGRTTGDQVEDFFGDIFKGATAVSVTEGVVSGGLDEVLKDEQKYLWDLAFEGKEKAPSIPTLLSGAGGGLTGYAGNVVTAIAHLLASKTRYNNSFIATESIDKVPLAHPPRAPRPIAYGPHLATVVGNNGIDASKTDISADALGRVRVRFPWDPGPLQSNDPTVVDDAFATGRNTCWVRVAQGWAGRAFGIQFLPRIGHEVVVEFIDGDPERPIITGSLYNADRGVPNLPFAAFKDGPRPFKPADLLAHAEVNSFERSGIKTSITPAAGGKPGFHLLRFDDTRGSEQLLLRSQGRFDVKAFRSLFETVHGNRHVLVKALKDDGGGGGTDIKSSGAESDANSSGGSCFITIGGEYDLHVGADRYEAVDKAAQLAVKADAAYDLQANEGTIVGKIASLNATKIVLEAQAKITLKVGGSFIVIDPCGVSISGPLVKINSGGSPDSTTDLEFIDPADATQADPGEPDNFLELQPKRTGGGGRRKRTVKAKHGLVCSANPDGTIQVTKSIKVDAKDPAYAEAVIQDLSTIAATNSGKALLDSLDASGKSVTVRKQNPAPNPPNAFASPTNVTNAGNGTGSDSNVDYNPDQWPSPTTRTKAPGDVILFHELQHADHNAQGTRDMTPRGGNFTNNEEFNTIGPENKYRDERGVPRRNDHSDL
jgi:uncharacterized protein involved in type VI secretion and phage assembly